MKTQPSEAVMFFGTDEELPKVSILRAGALSAEFDMGNLRHIRINGVEIIRAISFIIRDRDWGTYNPIFTGIEIEESDGAFTASYRATVEDGQQGLSYRAVIKANQGRLSFQVQAEATTDFVTNRTGFVVLHPIAGVAGAPVEVEQVDGCIVQSHFPELINPVQPMMSLRALTHEAAPGLHVTCRMEGDTFEMEDQRNWTDASFKIYSTPLSLPFPVSLAAGATVVQALELHVERIAVAAPTAPPALLVPIVLCASTRAVPTIGTSASTGPDPAADPTADPGILLVELDLAAANWRPLLIRAAAEAGTGLLDVRLISEDPRLIAAAIDELAPLAPARLGVFSPLTHVTEAAGWRALTTAAAAHLDAQLVGGTRAHFTELNRNHERLPAELPSLSYSSTPQMHARERAQLVESVAIQRLTARDAVRIAAGRPVHLGPVTLRPRFNAVATAPPPPEPSDLAHGSGPAHLEGATDPRQSSPALTAWLVASAAASSIDGIASLSFFEASGPRGVAGHPAAEAFAWLRELSGRPLLDVDPATPPPAGVWMLAADVSGCPVALVANLNSEPASVSLTLNSHTVDVTLEPLTARRVPLEIDPR